MERFDIFIVGGGINGCGIARDAAGRGYCVGLAEMNDLASGTSSGATKLIHGGLRYLEHYEFRLVREALMERERLWRIAPHIIWPLRFVLPVHKGLRPAWVLRLGLFLYDNLGGRKLLPPTTELDLGTDEAGKSLKPSFKHAFEYSDGWVNDSRMVVLNARSAAQNGASILPHTRVLSAKRTLDEKNRDIWEIGIQSSGEELRYVQADVLINAAGPWIDNVVKDVMALEETKRIRLVKGSHIVVKKLFDHDKCYIFQNADDRIIFAIPFEGDFTLIGTTDQEYDQDPGAVEISESEARYLCEAASEYFINSVTPDQIVWSYSAVRPLLDDGATKAQEATRDYVLSVANENGAPVINIYGGKLTTYRRLAEAVLEKVGKIFKKRGKSWTDSEPLPGGDFVHTGYESEVQKLRKHFAFLSKKHARRLVRLYGTLATEVLGESTKTEDLGIFFGGDLYEVEVIYLVENEWARTVEDIVWRRTKCGLHMDEGQLSALEAFLRQMGTYQNLAAAE